MTQKRIPGQCSCSGHYTDKWHRWVVIQRGGKSSKLYCLDCRAEWRSSAKYIVLLPNHVKRKRSGLTDEQILDAILVRKLFTVDLNTPRVFSASGKELRIEPRTHPEGEQKGTYRFVEICVDGLKKKVALHRLVWMVAHEMVTPEGCDVDHINSQDDDSISNLRLLNQAVNRGRRGRDPAEVGADEESEF